MVPGVSSAGIEKLFPTEDWQSNQRLRTKAWDPAVNKYLSSMVKVPGFLWIALLLLLLNSFVIVRGAQCGSQEMMNSASEYCFTIVDYCLHLGGVCCLGVV